MRTKTKCDPDVTEMRNGSFRAECGCGWWLDSNTFQAAVYDTRVHALNDACTLCLIWLRENDPHKYDSTKTYTHALGMAHRSHGGTR